MNIIIAINEAYIEPAKTMLFSLGCHHKVRFNVYLLYSQISDEKLQELKEWLDRSCHANLECFLIDAALFANAPKQKWWSNEIYYRLLAFDILPVTVERALWLDSDIIVNGSIDSFYSQSFDGNYAVVCRGCNQSLKDNLDLPDEHVYFNSGVILYNFKKIRTDFCAQDIFNCIDVFRNKLKAPDQDVLNILFTKNLKYADETIYNNETFGNYVLSKDKLIVLHTQARIIHFNGPMKPWNPRGANWADDLWWKYERKRGKKIAFFRYKLQNFPVKIFYYLREFWFIAISITKHFTLNTTKRI
ncbi:MAG: glycosyltransferase family 8 protein [Evtepia sp.]|nr:glycosyltransferase family 8 protein [Evtepia sp.]